MENKEINQFEEEKAEANTKLKEQVRGQLKASCASSNAPYEVMYLGIGNIAGRRTRAMRNARFMKSR